MVPENSRMNGSGRRTWSPVSTEAVQVRCFIPFSGILNDLLKKEADGFFILSANVEKETSTC